MSRTFLPFCLSVLLLIGVVACQDKGLDQVDLLLKNSVAYEGIIGGASVLPTDDPWRYVVFIKEFSSNGEQSCTGTMLSENVVLTAAHCVYAEKTRPKNIRVYFKGISNFKTNIKKESGMRVDRIIVHQDFNPDALLIGNDLALLKLKSVIPKYMHSVQLLSAIENDAISFLTLGYGVEYQDHQSLRNDDRSLQKIDLQIDHNSYFSNGQATFTQPFLFFEQAHGGACAGDSGGPLLTKYQQEFYLIGVTSFTFNLKDSKLNCSGSSSFTNLTQYVSWLKAKFLEISASELPVKTLE